MQKNKSFLPKIFHSFFSLNFDSRYIHNTISDDRIEMSINPGIRGVPANFNPSHATITVETCDPDTKEKEYRRSVDLSNHNYYLVMFHTLNLIFNVCFKHVFVALYKEKYFSGIGHMFRNLECSLLINCAHSFINLLTFNLISD